MTTLRAYHGDPKIKAKYLARMRAHRLADKLAQGETMSDGNSRGCAVACTFNVYDHSRGPAEIGYPEWLMHLIDAIFEGLPADEAGDFAEAVLAAAEPGVDLEPIGWHLAIERHERQLAALAKNSEPYAQQCRDAIAGVLALCRAELLEPQSVAAWSAAESAARSARSAARLAAESAAAATDSAAWSAAAAAKLAEWRIEREALLRLMREAKR